MMMDVRERTLAGRYRLEEVIGRGGMSTVYRATDQVLGRTVAVKVLLPALADQDPTYAERFEREARSAAALASSTVVTVYDTGVDEEGGQYIVMEYVSGHSLAELLADQRPLDISEALRIAQQVADALRAAHAAGILHRDIKPANVMVADDGAVKVLDFGIARTLDGTTLTQAASVVGTAAYMAPERALGKPGDARADVYSLGCLLYAMLTGRPPFTGEVPAAVLHQQVNSDPAPPSRLRAGIPAALDALVLQMLAKEPQARPRGAQEAGDRLRALLGLPPVAMAAGVTAATTPIDRSAAPTARIGSTAPTAAVRRASGRRQAPGAALGDHRWRAVLMGLVTALVALVAIALVAGGGSSPRAGTTSRTTSHSTGTTTRAPATKALTTQRTTPKAPAAKPAPKPADHKPANSKPGGPAGGPAPPGLGGVPPGHGGQPPGHRGQPPGHGEHH